MIFYVNLWVIMKWNGNLAMEISCIEYLSYKNLLFARMYWKIKIY